jgi:hypothetical protein
MKIIEHVPKLMVNSCSILLGLLYPPLSPHPSLLLYAPCPQSPLRNSPVTALNQNRGMLLCGHPKLPETYSASSPVKQRKIWLGSDSGHEIAGKSRKVPKWRFELNGRMFNCHVGTGV